ncbi:thiamine pyrophosphate-binding protein [Arthrobacter sunyaminii]|uniref:Thiamine pyrophosphate-binding protein n=1 Tax=Arthrobacter sunyaminii TaxID=2816859 RepID=A0A975S6L2_9MICC|nr:thiamine pyrophosphate-binding protein [Arthrobacter sunyaminii]MBO0909999.1 thiamine pyrophosphate-binding protein [Arthrobacter sunyaminii]QWQ36777.1 thiamine pyrophosphate-binding protein [Arthrobacter sunyaminii]
MDAPNIAALVGRTLARLGAGRAFGVVGSGNFHLTNALRENGVPFTAARHEGGAATMADAYARMSGRVAVLTTHQGCGLSNAATGIGEAAKSRTPLIVLTADTASSAVRSNFRIDQDGLARSMGAVAERIHSADSALADTVRAYRTAVNERRTVVLSVPLDLQSAAAPPSTLRLTRPMVPAGRMRPDAVLVRGLADLLASARRPVFVAGRGARCAGEEIASLAAHSGALLATSAVASGLFNGEDFNLGISGGFSTPDTADLIRGADLIIGWGCTLNMWTMRHGSLIGPDTAVVQVDVEDSALGANREIHLGVLGDCAATAADVLEQLKAGVPEPAQKYRTAETLQRIKAGSRWQDVPVTDASTADRIDPRVLSLELDALLPAERLVSVDSGNFMGYPSTHLAVPDEFGFCFTQAFQSIGLGLSTAIGAALARPDRLPVLGAGDGGFLMGISELETAVRLQLPLVAIIYNDAGYGAEVHHFAAGSGVGGSDADSTVDLDTVTFPDTDIAAIARGYGAAGITVRRRADLEAVKGWLAGPRNAPLVIDAKIASDGGAWWLAEAFRGH